MMRWPDRLRRGVRRLRGTRDYLDGLQGGVLAGWAMPKPGAGPVPVALYDQRGRVADTLASQFRADLQLAGIADGRCGFVFAVPAGASHLRVCRMDGPRPVEIGHVRVTGPTGVARPVPAPRTPPLQQDALAPGVAALRAKPVPAPAGPAALTSRQALLFANQHPETGDVLPDPLCAYMAYLRPRYRLEDQLPWETAPEEAAHFLHWMLTSYAPMRTGLKPPLSKRAIQWLNAPVVVPGQRTHLSRATWAALHGVPHLRQAMDLNNPDWVDSVLYWWAVHQARAISAEDCLVPDTYVARLAEQPEGGRFAMSRYLLRWTEETPALARLSCSDPDDRRHITLAAMVRAAERPDTLRYLPRASLELLLQQDADRQTPLGAYVKQLDHQDRRISAKDYAACLRGRGYDMQTRHFTSRTAEGHRLHAAGLPAPAYHGVRPVDVQIIGPVTKTSGLGQAMRASIAALDTTGLELQVVNFDLDNPAPDTEVPHVAFADARPARFTLLHLNAESIPLLTAYAPDITDRSYMAAYMFWELTRPASCHALALQMIDEVWAASEHGKAIYADRFDGPIRVMGLPNDVVPHTDPLGARAAFVARSGFQADAFLCMASFDSFSFVQRKNPLALIHAFREAFVQGEAQLLIKTQNRSRVQDPAQHRIWAQIEALTKGDPRFKILDETMDRPALLEIMAGADAYLSLHRAEGWGFGMVEAMALGVPVLATGYSGNLAYCDDTTAWLVPATLTAPKPDAYMFTPEGGLWGTPDHHAAVTLLRQMQADAPLRHRKAKTAQTHVMRGLSAETIGKRYATRIETVLRQHKQQAA
ncbi:glycosyltransferase [Marivita sp. S0852]|uniref:glycosyltransferase n=1 Tax=Marivita sp. S0852 TaxID=3373893 RepID=UPI003981D305